MEYVYGIIINNIIKYFNRVTISIEADKQILVFGLPLASVKPTVVFGSIKSPTDIGFRYVVLERGRVEFYDDVHSF